jgi:uncharacterized protein YceK
MTIGSTPAIMKQITGSRAVTVRLVVVSAFIAAVMTGCTTIAQAPSSQGKIPTDAQRRECERNGGHWATAPGYCKVGA